MADIEIKCTSKLAPVKGHTDTIYVINKGSHSVAYQQNPSQQELFEDAKEKVTPMNAGKGLA
jgi:hypothetical protein